MATSSTRYCDKTGQMPFGLYFGRFKFPLPLFPGCCDLVRGRVAPHTQLLGRVQGCVSVPRQQHCCRDIPQIKPTACSEPVC